MSFHEDMKDWKEQFLQFTTRRGQIYIKSNSSNNKNYWISRIFLNRRTSLVTMGLSEIFNIIQRAKKEKKVFALLEAQF